MTKKRSTSTGKHLVAADGKNTRPKATVDLNVGLKPTATSDVQVTPKVVHRRKQKDESNPLPIKRVREK
jgi:hypothetical protein